MALALATVDKDHPTLSLRADQADAYARTIAPAQRCNAAAVDAGLLELTLPTAEAIRGILEKPGGLVVTATDGATPVGLIVFTNAREPRNTGYVHWLFVDPLRAAELTAALADEAMAVRGWDYMWGRVTNVALHDAILTHPRVRERRGDPNVLEFPR